MGTAFTAHWKLKILFRKLEVTGPLDRCTGQLKDIIEMHVNWILQVQNSCKYSNKVSGFVKSEGFLNWLE